MAVHRTLPALVSVAAADDGIEHRLPPLPRHPEPRQERVARVSQSESQGNSAWWRSSKATITGS